MGRNQYDHGDDMSWKTFKEKIKDHPLYRSHILRQKLTINIYNTNFYVPGYNVKTKTLYDWTKLSKRDLTQLGYLKFIDFLKDWKYFGTKCYVRFHNLEYFDIDQWNRDHDKEEEKLCDIKSYGLYDFFKSKTLQKFKGGFSKLSLLNGMDSKMIGIIVIILAGVGLGLWFMFSGGF
mgnify:CR=1 FL=1